jgi:hypothetical protein
LEKVCYTILLASESELLKQFSDRYELLQLLRSSAFLASVRKDQGQQARHFGLVRKIPAIFREYAVASEAQGCYGVERKSSGIQARRSGTLGSGMTLKARANTR